MCSPLDSPDPAHVLGTYRRPSPSGLFVVCSIFIWPSRRSDATIPTLHLINDIAIVAFMLASRALNVGYSKTRFGNSDRQSSWGSFEPLQPVVPPSRTFWAQSLKGENLKSKPTNTVPIRRESTTVVTGG